MKVIFFLYNDTRSSRIDDSGELNNTRTCELSNVNEIKKKMLL